ncbi:EF-hand calcium-binding domain protein (macronuclear) [Tetrahymena thermophila SB210]|uniref:EF-hand calcium-binding domain protein n=1 Tax=Tetrahymena thermophila (strain SB210) TaxID=312017 RepID=W7WX86_TETTS|nr:EF-hand calcium-binding domain protein [Tetrahymena thermophila SB210]8TH8_I Chain I, EF-hand calcium-binding domain protein [Tetrahymena thermophila]8TH8_i Chain i, EF-hand calcium-binding domain protein [Tetrahymena thermophila]8TID_I Chain I, EF-hand calcium-binding domain protein [Tetrahymena thermophila]8TID_i Chain i, EF-hand calcium-binding domain protein [Tetrahymena thermophila]EWS71430.1 EF-hand calcium-binding domain protein [Tetrahymena thermophila SB210]|eukprot:XP_012656036.1 EF-hand calcium-binding domain protein [Tetrahymena thermophila SB210]
MYDPNTSQTEKQKQEEFLKLKIQEAFNLFVKDKKGIVDKREIPYIMRYLGQFPSEAQVRDAILPEIEEDEPSEFIKYSKFEPYMLKVLKEREYEPDDPEALLAAFKLLDQEGKGYIEIDMMKTFLEKQGIEFREQETKSFIEFATNKDPNATVIYYEDYISRLQAFTDKHIESVMKGYNNFQVKK